MFNYHHKEHKGHFNGAKYNFHSTWKDFSVHLGNYEILQTGNNQQTRDWSILMNLFQNFIPIDVKICCFSLLLLRPNKQHQTWRIWFPGVKHWSRQLCFSCSAHSSESPAGLWHAPLSLVTAARLWCCSRVFITQHSLLQQLIRHSGEDAPCVCVWARGMNAVLAPTTSSHSEIHTLSLASVLIQSHLRRLMVSISTDWLCWCWQKNASSFLKHAHMRYLHVYPWEVH